MRAREAAHLWADYSLDVLQGRVGGRRGAVWSGAHGAVAMMTGLPLPHRSVGQVTLEGETERVGVMLQSQPWFSRLKKTLQAGLLFPFKVFSFQCPSGGATRRGGRFDGTGINRCRGERAASVFLFWFGFIPLASE